MGQLPRERAKFRPYLSSLGVPSTGLVLVGHGGREAGPGRCPSALLLTDSKTTESGFGIAIRSFTYSTNPPTSKTHTHTRKEKKRAQDTPHTPHNTTTSAPAHTFGACPWGEQTSPGAATALHAHEPCSPPPAGSAPGIGG